MRSLLEAENLPLLTSFMFSGFQTFSGWVGGLISSVDPFTKLDSAILYTQDHWSALLPVSDFLTQKIYSTFDAAKISYAALLWVTDLLFIIPRLQIDTLNTGHRLK